MKTLQTLKQKPTILNLTVPLSDRAESWLLAVLTRPTSSFTELFLDIGGLAKRSSSPPNTMGTSTWGQISATRVLQVWKEGNVLCYFMQISAIVLTVVLSINYLFINKMIWILCSCGWINSISNILNETEI